MQKQLIEFVRAEQPITQPVSKFGGAPVWVAAPQWPLSRKTANPMLFIAQISLDPALFGGEAGRVAYLFMTDEEDVDNTWDANGGENALIIQPSDAPLPIGTAPLSQGPSLFELVPLGKGLAQNPCEFAINLSPPLEDEEPDSDKDDFDSQIGGFPVWLQGDETPGEESGQNWRLLLQFDSTGVPFDVNFGDAGVGYAFLSPDGKRGLFLWQCA